MDTTIKENATCKNILTQGIREIQDTMKRTKLRIIGINETEDFQLKGLVNIFNKIKKKTSLTLRKRCPLTYKKPTAK